MGRSDPGEAEALALAVEIQADWLLLDERAVRERADALGINYTGLIGLLARAKQKGLVPSVKPLLNALRHQAGFWISPALYQHVLQQVGEAP